jgi:hypothetical protein
MRNFIKMFIFSILTISLIYFMSIIFRPTWDADFLLSNLKEHENEFDVLFIGDSDVFADISPMEIYKQVGITSYDYAAGNASNLLMYYMVKESLKYQKPSLVVIDCASIFNNVEQEERTHQIMDGINDDVKWEFLNDSAYDFDFNNKMKFVFPLFRFHNKWSEITTKDLAKLNSNTREESYYLKGFNLSYQTQAASNGDSYMDETEHQTEFATSVLPEAVLRIKKLCEENGIKFLLVSLPDTQAWSDAKSEKMAEWTKENNVDFLDINTLVDEININYDKDTRDGGIHLNMYGAIKVSDYLAKYIKKHYNIEEHYEEAWDQDLIKYENRMDLERGK